MHVQYSQIFLKLATSFIDCYCLISKQITMLAGYWTCNQLYEGNHSRSRLESPSGPVCIVYRRGNMAVMIMIHIAADDLITVRAIAACTKCHSSENDRSTLLPCI